VDPTEVEAFLDGYMAAHLEAHDQAGATVSVVKDGRLLFAKGYGLADVKGRVPVSADRTLFRIGSISKLFVWTAVMQLVDQGRLDLNTDINTYLAEFEIPPTYPEPVTLSHLMSHTPGFEDCVLGLFARDADALRPLGEILAVQVPARVRPPGDLASYSNHGTAMAAYIVEQVSGLGWNDYVERKILTPLGMERTTFRQPVPKPLDADASRGYSYSGGEFHEEAFEFIPLAPAGAAGTTATDMARFMIAHLQMGQLEDQSILSPDAARQMQEPLFRHAAALNPMSHGFIDMSMNRQWVIGHGGNTFWFHSMLALLPEHDVGFFVSYNTAGGGEAAVRAYEAFMDRYYPAGDVEELAPPEDAGEVLNRFAGTYRSNRRAHERFTKILALFGAIRVEVTEDGRLKTMRQEATHWLQTGPLTFREEDGLRILTFREDDAGRVTHMFMGDLPIVAFEKIGFLETPAFHLGVLGTATGLFLAALVFWPVGAFIRRRHGVRSVDNNLLPAPARLLGWIASGLFVLFVIGFVAALSDPNEVAFGVPAGLKALLWLPILAGAAGLGALAFVPLVWASRRGSIGARLFYTFLTLGFLAALWQLNFWKLLGFHY
jgi:CubicO group peptidase (beta-lactamase class C family)